MIETEAKILGIDRKVVEAALLGLGARKTFDGEMDARLFDRPDRSIWSSGRLLRLRKRGDRAELTFKKMLGKRGVKRAVEIETAVSDFGRTRKILLALGFVEAGRRRKLRTSYRLGGAEFEIDVLPGIPPYLEIEARDEREIRRLAGLLGFRPGDLKPWSMRDVIRHYRKR